MRVYFIQSNWLGHPLAEPVFDNEDYVHLPGVFCPECGADRLFWKSCATIYTTSEAVEAVRELLTSYQPRSEKVRKWLKKPIDESWLQKTLLPEDFTELCQEVRPLLGLPDDFPLSEVQCIAASAFFRMPRVPPEWDVWGGVEYGYLTVSPPAAQLLQYSGLTGFELYPVEVLDKRWRPVRDYVVYAVVFRGRGGLPRTEPEGFWRRCTRCGHWQLTDYRAYDLEIDPSQWDGSDFFHFVDYGPPVVTERARAWFERSGLRLWVRFLEPKEGWYRWYFSEDLRARANAEHMRKFFPDWRAD